MVIAMEVTSLQQSIWHLSFGSQVGAVRYRVGKACLPFYFDVESVIKKVKGHTEQEVGRWKNYPDNIL